MAPQQPDSDDLIAGINITPLVDIALVLLVIFMVTAKVLASPAVAMNLPPSATSTDVQSRLSLEMSADGAVAVNGTRATADSAILALAKTAKTENPDVQAVIRADRSVSHGRVIRAIDLLKQAGIAKVAFSVAAAGEPGPLIEP